MNFEEERRMSRRRKLSKQTEDMIAERLPGRRQINKTQAARHLLHASIRMHLSQEDPFATHLIAHSCDKLITDLIKANNLPVALDFLERVKDEYKGAFLYVYREMYNYLKHADDDADLPLEVRNIYETNELTIFLNCGRYLSLPDCRPSAHAHHFLVYVAVRSPHLVKAEGIVSAATTVRGSTRGVNYGMYVEAFRQDFLARVDVKQEIRDDLVDVHATRSEPWWRD